LPCCLELFNKINNVPEFTQSLSVPPVEPRGQARHISWPVEPVAPLSSADSLREQRDLVARHPDRIRIHPKPKPWLSRVGAKPFFILGLFWFEKNLPIKGCEELRLARLRRGLPSH
jgi:hypothetical protein